jgi:glycine/D-amino acid oxidase-like deaminating enzyme
MRRSSHSEVLVLGAGLAGCCAAIELADRGLDVVLVDQDDRAMNRASLRNEGKIHLGFVYANDRSTATGYLQLAGALRFGPLLRRWLGGRFERIDRSTPFTYLVACDSLLSPHELAEHYEKVDTRYRSELASDPGLDYLGTRPDELWREASTAELDAHFARETLGGGFRTAELALDTSQLALAVREAVAGRQRITFLPDHRVREVEERHGLLSAAGTSSDGSWELSAEHVLNATWESRLALDRHFGIEIAPGWLHRLKYRVIARLPATMGDAPSVTMVLGRYGDVVVRPAGSAYLSWYPVGLRGWTHDTEPPATWDAACRGDVDAETAAEIATLMIEAIGRWYPGVLQSSPELVDAGVVVAYGTADVDKSESGLHDRTRVGVHSAGRFHSIDPGKLTTAPLFAMAAADRVAESRD